jgi:catechol 2,3-dioxygenase-like lactoylglutathione lyase family enzyme
MTDPTRPAMPGIHHVTGICADPQPNLEFYVGLLGLRLVKKTVNFDDRRSRPYAREAASGPPCDGIGGSRRTPGSLPAGAARRYRV